MTYAIYVNWDWVYVYIHVCSLDYVVSEIVVAMLGTRPDLMESSLQVKWDFMNHVVNMQLL